MTSESLIASLRAAVEASPDDVPLRLHLAQLLREAGLRDDAVREAAAVLLRDPSNPAALQLLRGDEDDVLRRLDAEFAVPPPFVDDDVDEPAVAERPELTLADVGGLVEVKARLEAAFLAPLRNPELVKVFGKSLRGGLLLYGPPGCGKTFLARALAGEMGASFVNIGIADVLDMYVGQSERNVHAFFESARSTAPCVVFIDEVDALGHKRSGLANSAARGAVNQLLTELDGVGSRNEGVYVVGATNHPWDVDVAFRRPGRFDRMLFVAPPDQDARESILRFHLRDRPIAGVDPRKLARATDGFTGADLAHVCESAAETALLASARSGTIRMIEMRDLEAAAKEIRPSLGPWLETARNVAQFGNESGAYDELRAYLRGRKML